MAAPLGGRAYGGGGRALGGGMARVSVAKNPALAAMQTADRSVSMPNARIGGSANTQPAPYQPSTDLTSGQQANYSEWFSNNDKNAAMIQDIGQRNLAAGSRKNAMLAAMSGSGGGAAYLSGQRAAMSNGLATMNNALLANNQARDTIYGNKRAALGGLAQGAQNYNNRRGTQNDSQQFTAEREDAKAANDARTGGLSAQRARSDAAMQSRYKDNPNSDVFHDYNAIAAQIDQAIGSGDYETAQRLQDQLNNFNCNAYGGDGKRR